MKLLPNNLYEAINHTCLYVTSLSLYLKHQTRHLILNQLYETYHFTLFPQQQLNEMVKTGKLQQDPDGFLMHPPSEDLEELLQPPIAIDAMPEYFNDGHYGKQSVSLYIFFFFFFFLEIEIIDYFIVLNINCSMVYLENKGIVFKARWFVRPDINTGATII